MSETTPQQLPHQELRDALKAGPTGGRWRWEINLMSKCLHLVGGPHREFDLTIMDFDRWGMSNAVATLRDPSADGMNIMHRLPDRKDWFAPFPGRAHHADWCQQVTHPDMKWIEAANPKAITALLKDRDQLATDAQNCKELIWALARELKCLPSTFSDANGQILKAAIALNTERDRLTAEVEALRVALRFYGTGEHFHIDPDEDWDSVSGEPENWLCSDREGSTTMFENGTVARMTLQGKSIDWSAEGEDCTPSMVPDEAPAGGGKP